MSDENNQNKVQMNKFLPSFFSKYEDLLESLFQTSSLGENQEHKGYAREIFIKDFLQKILPDNIGISSGEIINQASQVDDVENRPQNDLILYKTNFPKFHLAGDKNFFLAESVLAVIEVKSYVNIDAVKQAIGHALKLKTKKQMFNLDEIPTSERYYPKKFPYFIIGFEGDSLQSIKENLINNSLSNLTIKETERSEEEILMRMFYDLYPLVDGCFVIQKGAIQACSLPGIVFSDDYDQNKVESYVIIEGKYSLFAFYSNILELLSGYSDFNRDLMRLYM